jgi:ABC-type branched-subunit amino acid transport system substrate-binding protein
MYVYYEDSEGNTTKAVSAYSKMRVMHNPQIYMVTVSPIAIALKPLMKRDSVISIVQSAHRDVIGNDCPLIFRYCLTIKQEAECIYSSMKTLHNVDLDSQISLLYVNNEIGNEFCTEFVSNSKFNNVKTYSYEPTDMDLKNIVTSVLNNPTEHIVISGYTKNYGILVRRLREYGYDGKIFANQGFSTNSVREAAGRAGNNVFYDDYYLPYNPKIEKLERLLHKKYGADLCPMHITSYNMMHMIANSCNEIGSTSPKAIVKYWHDKGCFNINESELKIIPQEQDIYIPIQLKENVYE